MRRKQRSLNHIKEEISYHVLREEIPETWVIHEYGPDYGIDCVIELFDYIDEDKRVAETLGEMFFVQLKSSSCIEYTTRRIYPRRNVEKGQLQEDKSEHINIDVAKFVVETSELHTIQSMGLAVPVLLILVDTNTREAFFICVNDYIDKILYPENPDFSNQETKTIYIPLQNKISKDDLSLLTALRAYGKRSKMYGAFGKFNYQKNELERAVSLAFANSGSDLFVTPDMLSVFIETALRQDIWVGHEFWEPVQQRYKELCQIKNLLSDVKQENYQAFLEQVALPIWFRLSDLGNIYEELVREWFLPTFLAQLTSYPHAPEIISAPKV